MKRPRRTSLRKPLRAMHAPAALTVVRFKRLHLLHLEIELYLDHLRRKKKLRPSSCASNRAALKLFLRTLAENRLDYSPRMIGPMLLADVLAIHETRGISGFTYFGYFSRIRLFFQHLADNRVISSNPFDELETPQKPQLVPKPMAEHEVLEVLDAPDIANFHGLRTKVILEILYGSGLRIRECLGLKKLNIRYGPEREPYLALVGKGGKYREVPVTEVAIRMLLDFGHLVGVERDQDFFFQGVRNSEPLSYTSFHRIYKNMLAANNLPSNFTLHRFRHSFASHLLDHGADIKSVQELMGHSMIATTMGYTKVSTARLREVHRLYHPRGKAVILKPAPD